MAELSSLESFKCFIWNFYHQNKRAFAWRNIDNAYAIVVSEIMLQQTQTHRVEQKYEQFLAAFPTFESLAEGSLHDVLGVWQGLGYNRRGKYLHQIAQKIVSEYDGILPNCPDILITLPGIGAATASSICAFAFNQPVVFIETNIRAVFIHMFFKDRTDVHDKELLPLITATVDQDNPREWYYALMDYGVFLKKTVLNPSRKSKHYAKQTRFEGSDRQIRGAIIRLLTQSGELAIDSLTELLNVDKTRIELVVGQLVKEGFIFLENNCMRIA